MVSSEQFFVPWNLNARLSSGKVVVPPADLVMSPLTVTQPLPVKTAVALAIVQSVIEKSDDLVIVPVYPEAIVKVAQAIARSHVQLAVLVPSKTTSSPASGLVAGDQLASVLAKFPLVWFHVFVAMLHP